MRRAALIAALIAGSLSLTVTAQAGADRTKWDTRVFAQIPDPGFPARAYVAPDGRVFEGTYVNPLGDHMASRVFEYGRHGHLLKSWTVPGQDLNAEHGVQVATSDDRGRLVLLDRTPARALLLNPRNGRFRRYATFEDLPTCQIGRTGPDCSPNLVNMDPSANYAAWGLDGSLYVTDFLQAVIWRVPPGGGAARVWLASRRFDGVEFGTTGIVLAPDHRTLLIGQQSSAGLGELNPTTGKIYSVRIRGDGDPGKIKRLWASKPVDGPDGFALARSGNIYVALAGSNQIAEVGPSGDEVDRFPPLPIVGSNGSPVAFDTPSSAMFTGKRILVANQSYFTGMASHQAILDVAVGERGLPEFIPRLGN
jgi:sugar lactone lactonase YvrE